MANDKTDLLGSILRSGGRLPSSSSPSPLDSLFRSIPAKLSPVPSIAQSLLPSRVPIFRIAPKNEAELVRRIRGDTARVIKRQFRLVEAQKIPEIPEVAYDEAKILETSTFHIDIRDSSEIVKIYDPITALKIYKIFHASVVNIARFKGGRIRSFAGDRIAVLFDIGELRRTKAVETALLTQSVIDQILNPILLQGFSYQLDCGIGVDFGKMLVGRIGQYGNTNNDLVWAGKAMNYASQLADYGSGVFISDEVYLKMDKHLREDVGMMWQPIKDLRRGNFYKFIGILDPLA